ncbi:MAG: hypothetical protein K0U40_01400, partial [Betaproteobacteria bacterium]|nr:hypothetical protein [Betaproteobacteria bacterium]
KLTLNDRFSRLTNRSLETGYRLLMADKRLRGRFEINLARCQIRFELAACLSIVSVTSNR